MREGSLDAPTRHPIDWQNPDFLDADKLDAEMRRQFDICHGCRRCFNLCDSFPRLFDLVDEQEDEVEGEEKETETLKTAEEEIAEHAHRVIRLKDGRIETDERNRVHTPTV